MSDPNFKPESSPSSPPNHKDKSKGLLAVGIILIIFGAFSAILGLLTTLSSALLTALPEAVETGMSPAAMIAAGLFIYGGMAAFFITLGIGTIRARRWARALMLTISWMALILGSITMVCMLFVMPDFMQQAAMQQARPMPSGISTFTQILMFGCGSCVYIFIPAGFVAFFRSPHVKATCEARNPNPSWTDACPLPVLALSLHLGFMAATFLYSSLIMGFIFALFGTYINGLAGALVIFPLMALYGLLAWGVYKLKMWAWIGSLVTVALVFISYTTTIFSKGLVGMYEKMDIPEATLEIFRQQPLYAPGGGMGWFAAAMGALFVGYILFLFKYFKTPTS